MNFHKRSAFKSDDSDVCIFIPTSADGLGQKETKQREVFFFVKRHLSSSEPYRQIHLKCGRLFADWYFSFCKK